MRKFFKTSFIFVFFAANSIRPTSLSWGAAGNSFYAAPQGSATGDGSLNNPWDLQTALNQPSRVNPGDTLFLRGGLYTKPPTFNNQLPLGFIYLSKLAGTSTNPIVVRSQLGEHAIIDGGAVPGGNGGAITLDVTGSYTWYIDLEILSSINEARQSSGVSSFPPDITRPDGMYVYGVGNKVINCILHDMTAGLSPWASASQFEAYGNLIYNNGWQGTARAQGHNIYTQNYGSSTPKIFRDNILINAFDFNVQAYGTSNAEVVGYRFDNNFLVNRPVLVGGYATTPVDDIQFTNNLGYLSSAQFRYHEGNNYQDVLVDSNYLVASGSGFQSQGWLEMAYWQKATVKNNILVTTSGSGVSCNAQLTYPTSGGTYSNWVWNNNTYYGGGIFNTNLAPFPTFAQWKIVTGFDRDSILNNALPSLNKIVLRANQYDSNRANLAIYNWQNSNTVDVDLSSLGWTNGDSYDIHSAADYDHDIVHGTYNGGLVSINMQAGAHSVQLPLGWPHPVSHTWTNTFPQYGAFILINTSAQSIIPTDTNPPTAPQNLNGSSPTPTKINLIWTGSTDNFYVAGYKIFKNGIQLGTSFTPFYQDSGLTPDTPYTYTISAFDGVGNTSAQSPSTTLIAGALPPLTISIDSPSSGSIFGAPADITITASASAQDGVKHVDFFHGYQYMGTVNSTPYIFTWKNVPAGNFLLIAQVTDNNNLTTSTSVDVKVNSGSNGIPQTQNQYNRVVDPTKNQSVMIPCQIDSSSHVLIEIFNPQMVKLKTILNSDIPAGDCHANWDGKNENGQNAAAGVYLAQKSINGKVEKPIYKIVVIK